MGFARLFRPTLAGANMGHPSSARWPVLFIAPLSCPAGASQSARDDKGRAAFPFGIGYWDGEMTKGRAAFPRKIRRTAGPWASLLMNNRTLDRPRALDGLRPSFSAHVRWCEHGAPVQCAAAGTVHCSLNLPQASRLLGMTRVVMVFSLALVRDRLNCRSLGFARDDKESVALPRDNG